MDVTLVLTIVTADGSSPHHSRPPALRRTLPDVAAVPLTPAGPSLRARAALPPIGATFALTLSGHNFFDAEIAFSVLMVGPAPTILALSDLIRRVTTHREPSGMTVVSFEVLAPQLREVAGPGAVFESPQSVSRIQDDPLAAFPRPAPVGRGNGVTPPREPSGNSFLDPIEVQVDRGRLRFFEHRQGHPLIATYVPRRALPTAGDYLVYFKPPKHNAATPKQVVESYLTQTGRGSLLGAIELSRTTATLCFLIGEAGNPSAALTTANGIAGLVQEIDARLRAGNPFLAGGGVRSVALAGFSQGGEYLARVMRNVGTSRLSGLLKAVFVFDCFFPDTQAAFKTDLHAWFNAASDLVIRSYWGHTVHRCDLYEDQPATPGDDGTETRTVPFGHPAGVPDYMWVHFTEAFLQHRCKPLVDAGVDLHHAIPKLFLVHALQTAGMARSLN